MFLRSDYVPGKGFSMEMPRLSRESARADKNSPWMSNNLSPHVVIT